MTETDTRAKVTQPGEPPLGKGWLHNYLPMGVGQIVALMDLPACLLVFSG